MGIWILARHENVGIARIRWNCSSGVTLAMQMLAFTETRVMQARFHVVTAFAEFEQWLI
jgi:hypothetical protein